MARAPRQLTPRSAEDVWAEGALLAGGGRAILLQLAHPAVADGVARHSDFERDPVRRLTGTLEYVYVLAFGTSDEVAVIAREVGGAHRSVRGVGSVPYDARDSRLQLWVAATLYESTVVSFEALCGRLPDHVADELYDRDALLGTALGMPAGEWPPDRSAFTEYWGACLSSLEVGHTARRVAHALMRPRSGPLWMRAGMPLVRVVTAGLLPEELRAAYGVEWNERLERRLRFLLRFWGTVYRALPAPVRRLPSRLLLRRFRARTTLGAGGAFPGAARPRT